MCPSSCSAYWYYNIISILSIFFPFFFRFLLLLVYLLFRYPLRNAVGQCPIDFNYVQSAGEATQDELMRMFSLIYAAIKHDYCSISMVSYLFPPQSFSIHGCFSSPLALRHISFIIYIFPTKLEAFLRFFSYHRIEVPPPSQPSGGRRETILVEKKYNFYPKHMHSKVQCFDKSHRSWPVIPRMELLWV